MELRYCRMDIIPTVSRLFVFSSIKHILYNRMSGGFQPVVAVPVVIVGELRCREWHLGTGVHVSVICLDQYRYCAMQLTFHSSVCQFHSNPFQK